MDAPSHRVQKWQKGVLAYMAMWFLSTLQMQCYKRQTSDSFRIYSMFNNGVDKVVWPMRFYGGLGNPLKWQKLWSWLRLVGGGGEEKKQLLGLT